MSLVFFYLYIIVGSISSVLLLSLIITSVFVTAVCCKKRDKVKKTNFKTDRKSQLHGMIDYTKLFYSLIKLNGNAPELFHQQRTQCITVSPQTRVLLLIINVMDPVVGISVQHHVTVSSNPCYEIVTQGIDNKNLIQILTIRYYLYEQCISIIVNNYNNILFYIILNVYQFYIILQNKLTAVFTLARLTVPGYLVLLTSALLPCQSGSALLC